MLSPYTVIHADVFPVAHLTSSHYFLLCSTSSPISFDYTARYQYSEYDRGAQHVIRNQKRTFDESQIPGSDKGSGYSGSKSSVQSLQ